MDGIKPPGRRGSRDFSGSTPVSGDSKGEMDGAGAGGSGVPVQVQPRNIALDKLTLDAPRRYGLGHRDRAKMPRNAEEALDEQGGPSVRVKGWHEDFFEDLGKIDPAFKATAAPSDDDDADIELRLPMRGASPRPASATSVIAPPTHQVAAQAQAQVQPQSQLHQSQLQKALAVSFRSGISYDGGRPLVGLVAHLIHANFRADPRYMHHADQLRESIRHDKIFLQQVNKAEKEGRKKGADNHRADYLFLRKNMSSPEIGTRLLMIEKNVRKELLPFFSSDSCSDFTSEDTDELIDGSVAAIMGEALKDRDIPQLNMFSNYAGVVKKLLTEIAAEASKKEDGKSK